MASEPIPAAPASGTVIDGRCAATRTNGRPVQPELMRGATGSFRDIGQVRPLNRSPIDNADARSSQRAD